MTQKWNVTSYPKAAVGDAYDDVATRLIRGVDTAATHYAGTAEPSGGTWDADAVGTLQMRTANMTGAGDGLGPEFYQFIKTHSATPTYAWEQMRLRGYIPLSAATLALTVTNQTNVSFVDLDLGGTTSSDRAVAVLAQVEVNGKAPGAGVYIEFRKNGVTADSLSKRAYPQVADITSQYQFEIEVDGSQVIEYAVVGGTTIAARLDIVGYYERR